MAGQGSWTGTFRRALGAVALAMVAVAFACGQAGAADPATRSCGWTIVGSGSQVNVLFPDEAGTYWTSSLPMPPGGHIEINGQYPHARYTSLTTYTGQLQSIDGLNDTRIAPDAGSTNPFLPKANRRAARRDYTVKVVNARVPQGERAPNTLYTTNADGSKTGGSGTQRVWLRIYEGDKGQGRAGGVPLPQITLVNADGQRTTLPVCPNATLPDTGLTSTLANSGANVPSPVDTGRGGQDPPVWRKFVNVASSVLWAAQLDGTVTEDTLPEGGFGENPDNKYIATQFTHENGQVLAFRAKAPTTPKTYDGQKRMGTGQLRYWSFCTNSQTSAYYGCRQDDQVPLDERGRYTIVVSTAAARPRNANEACGAAWVPAGPAPQSLLIVRNMLPVASFAQAIQNAKPGTEQQTMGEYYPRGTYYATTADYERLGCAKSK